ncbi:Sugar kinase of the NBD/HSP70 family, may contain an N-terminal HTH domain [Actinokineospora alba]|uniref:Sugar kinase of the NBD/HSP70 family, may contain an N-terminal HTH domain n=1 Tax=Actinokineospora alba TaxID=504798 RepID=A0A1H0JB83_9PSEU|nr:ROK family transcriptional regulator [Actinokineospora alba]TDP68356.1 putative NBD/HSP70 family sugar kinase [Actinokineospora alba]SDH77380.1 Sugar kinase of the NBD/HSP70 family, may contain an N-terminal HTH domain [Actinokineospora alba]SDO41045.1 Sugar kinase of the NBD/HSP70 family, may contain an N-terminal HTH domain [Actinokineospora alba]
MSTPTAGARPDEVRRHNRTALLRRLHVDGPSTRAELATELGLNRSTIKALVDGLAESGIVLERVPRARSGAGRPSLLVLPQPQAAVVLAVDIRVEQVAIALVGLGGEMLGRNRWNLHRRSGEPDEVITHIIESTRVLADELDLKIYGVGVSVPGVVRRSDGFVHEAPNLRWRDVPLGDRLRATLGVPVRVANDAEVGALAEHLRGAARGSLDAVYVSADIGIGGGVISDGSALRGTGGYVGELGHMIINPTGRDCHCGSRGCWETEVGELALCRALALSEGTPRGVVIAELRGLRADEVGPRLGEFREWLTLGLVNIVNAFSPELVVLGDLFTALPPSLIAAVGAEVGKRSLVSRAIGGTRVQASTLGTDGKLVGAAELAFEPVLDTV